MATQCAVASHNGFIPDATEKKQKFKSVTFNKNTIEEALNKNILKISSTNQCSEDKGMNALNVPNPQKTSKHYEIGSKERDVCFYSIRSSVLDDVLNYDVEELFTGVIKYGGEYAKNFLTPEYLSVQSLHYDFLALKFLEDYDNPEAVYSVVCAHKGKCFLSFLSISLDQTVMAARGKIKLEGNTIKFREVLMKTSTWISITPKNKDLSMIKSIKIFPRLYYYKQFGSIYLSNTTFLAGTIDFAKSLVDLKVFNAEVTITFNKKILGEND